MAKKIPLTVKQVAFEVRPCGLARNSFVYCKIVLSLGNLSPVPILKYS